MKTHPQKEEGEQPRYQDAARWGSRYSEVSRTQYHVLYAGLGQLIGSRGIIELIRGSWKLRNVGLKCGGCSSVTLEDAWPPVAPADWRCSARADSHKITGRHTSPGGESC